jgi:phosphonate transport system substrate-binding protein
MRTGVSAARFSAALFSLVLFGAALGPASASDVVSTNELVRVNIAFSKSMFKDINENDARAAMRVYTKTIGDENALDTSAGAIYLDGTNAIAGALRLKQFDMISLSAEEFLVLEDQGLDGPFLLSQANQSVTEEYVLLVRCDSSIRKLEDLPGHTMAYSNDLRASLVPIWLEVLCRENGLGPMDQVFARVRSSSKPAQVVLPVFFGKVDACVVSRYSWDVMGELNPQLKKQLQAIAVSPAVVPGMSCFRRDFSAVIKQRVLDAATGSHNKPSFKQLMALFKTDELSCEPASVLDSTRQLMASYHRLCSETGPVKTGGTEPGISLDATANKGK